MRVIGGSLKRRKLMSVPGMDTRPTSDRLRETIFNIISFKLQEAVVLDLFAGTGALGIEAVSRGASKVFFVEKNRSALNVIKSNVSSCGIEDISILIQYDIVKDLHCLDRYKELFDLVLMDPPYSKNTLIPTLTNLGKSGVLKKNATIVVEHSKLEKIPENITGFSLEDQRKYGKTSVSFLEYCTNG